MYRNQQQQQPPPSASSTNYSAYAPAARGASAAGGAAAAGASPATSQTSNMSNHHNNNSDIEAGREIARTHFQELSQYLAGSTYFAELSAKAGSSKEKLTRLTRQQFSELSKDVYDELMRRKAAEASLDAQPEPFLLSQASFHPKRNQARQKLATLPTSRFKDLASDVCNELGRRYPEFFEDPTPQFSQPPRQGSPQKRPISPPYTAANASQLASKQPSLSKTLERATPNEVLVPNKSTLVEEEIAGPTTLNGSGPAGQARLNHLRQRSDAPSLASLRGQDRLLSPLQTGGLGSMHEDLEDASVTSADRMEDLRGFPSPGGNNNNRNLQAAQRTSEGSSVAGQLGNVLQGYTSGASSYAGGIQSMMKGMTSPTSPGPSAMPLTGNTGALAAKTKELQEAYDALQQAQDDLAAARNDSENRTRTLEEQINNLEAEFEEEQRQKKRLNDRLREIEADFKGQMKRIEEQTAQLESYQREYDELSQRHEEEISRSQKSGGEHSRAQDEAQREIRQLREQVQDSERALVDAQNKHSKLMATQRSAADPAQVASLKSEAASLLGELQSLNIKYEQLAQSHEREVERTASAQRDTEMWKTRYQRAKTELRALKATSQLVVQPAQITETLNEDFMPTTATGGIADFHITIFQSSIDVLLVTGRSESPSSVLKAANAVVMAVGKLDDDVQAFENADRTQELSSTDRDRLQALKARCHSTLSNLITASKNHASSHGFSPVSLLDAAASHLSITVFDLIKLLKVRKANEKEIADFQREQNPNTVDESDISDEEENGGWSRKYNYPTAGTSPQKQFHIKSNGSALPHEITRPAVGVQGTMGSPSRSFDSSERRPFALRQNPELSPRGPNSPRALKLSDPLTSPRVPVLGRMSLESKSSGGRNGYTHSPQSSYGDEPAQPFPRSLAARLNTSEKPLPSPERPVKENTSATPSIKEQSPVLLTHPTVDQDDLSPAQPEGTVQYDKEQFKGYLENQTENIVQAIQSLLSAIRGGRQGQDLLADLNTISGLVIGIVDATRDNLPSQSQTQAKEIRADLKTNYRKLDDLQTDISQGKFDKTVKQSVAAASFAIARSLKQLNLMFTNNDEA